MILVLAMAAWILAGVGAVTASLFRLQEVLSRRSWRRLQHDWAVAEKSRLAEQLAEAAVIDAELDAYAVEWARVHYRHNVHCPKCGRFARRAAGFAGLVADCDLHGVVGQSEAWTGALPIIVHELPKLDRRRKVDPLVPVLVPDAPALPVLVAEPLLFKPATAVAQ